MRSLAILSYLAAGGTGMYFCVVLGIWMLLILNLAGYALLACLLLVSLSLLIAVVMAFFSPGRAATLAFRASAAGLIAFGIGTVLMLAGKLFRPSEYANQPEKFDTTFWVWFFVAPSVLLAASLWVSSRMRKQPANE